MENSLPNTVPFKDRAFNFCFNCGWGEKGVHDMDLSYEQAYALLVSRGSKETAERWAENEETYFEFRDDYYMIADCDFEEEDWEGSQDY
jgi:hypothetical protein